MPGAHIGQRSPTSADIIYVTSVYIAMRCGLSIIHYKRLYEDLHAFCNLLHAPIIDVI